jgi:tungstate transport system substrate-binding protein
MLPKLKEYSGITVKVVALGTGQAIKNVRNGDGDVLLVRAKLAEEKFVADSFSVTRHDLMPNNSVILGPLSDRAKIAGGKTAAAAVQKIAEAKPQFGAHGDDPGTHKKEKRL